MKARLGSVYPGRKRRGLRGEVQCELPYITPEADTSAKTHS